MHLYETHLPVANTEIAKDFYTEVVGLPFAYRDPTRDIVFLWAASKEQGMIGLGTEHGLRAGKWNCAKMPRRFRRLLRSIARRD